ncbi:crossover junction endonuclease EME1 [Trichuris suis]|nr:crossover junction endonuclease EME1 [Trichuris suis]
MDCSDDDIIDLRSSSPEIATADRASVSVSYDCFAFAQEALWMEGAGNPEEISVPEDDGHPLTKREATFSDLSDDDVDTIVIEDKAENEKKSSRRRKAVPGCSVAKNDADDNLKDRKKAKQANSKSDKVETWTAERILSQSTILIDPRLPYAQQLEQEIERNVTANMKKCRSQEYPSYVEAHCMAWKNVIGFSRPKVEPTPSEMNRVMDEEVLWIMDVQEFIRLVYNTVNASPMDFPDVGVSNLPNRASELENQFHPVKVRITALVLNLSAYFNDLRKYEAAVVRACMTNKEPTLTKGRFPVLSDCKVTVSKYQVTQALVCLQMEKSICCYSVDGLEEVAKQAIDTCRAIAGREYNTQRMEVHNFSFLPEGEVAKGVRVDRATGSGYKKLWKQVLEQCFGRCFPEGAEAIAKKYGCLRALLDAYDKLSLVAEKETLLANLVVETKNGFNRRLGEAYSKKVFLALTSKDPDLVL